ncbi:hypothetical protein LKR43_11265 [Pusillimonas sp. MFBS29]|uniref:hypothetical protein n=1 Tax=Pusillimonas sp. MFBS29 TaxID=2886690 RepID=UPI001D102061|nr:hypothetical protein [Pusillimonas sp. MFBS29]MCC2596919.1 hypothetical protein [Pusillimonas sp. MFBS29]
MSKPSAKSTLAISYFLLGQDVLKATQADPIKRPGYDSIKRCSEAWLIQKLYIKAKAILVLLVIVLIIN